MNYPKAIAHKGPVGRGATLPQIFSVEGLGDCLVKFAQSDHGPKALVNELIGFQVADVLGLEHPECGVVEIEAEVLPDDGKLEVTSPYGDRFTFLPGLAFYSRWLPSAEHPTPDDLNTLELANPRMLAGVVVLDLLLGNWDRTAANPNLLLERRGQRRLVVIDLGLAFGGGLWELGNLRDTSFPPLYDPLPYGEGLDRLLRTVNPATDFSSYLGKMSELSRPWLESIVGTIPSEWGISPREREALVDYVYTKARNLPAYLEQRLQKQEWWR